MESLTNDQRLAFREFTNALTELAVDMTTEQTAKLVEMTMQEQKDNWARNSPGWKVLEAFKAFLQVT